MLTPHVTCDDATVATGTRAPGLLADSSVARIPPNNRCEFGLPMTGMASGIGVPSPVDGTWPVALSRLWGSS